MTDTIKIEKRQVFCRELNKPVEQLAQIRYSSSDELKEKLPGRLYKTLSCSGSSERIHGKGQCCGNCYLVV